MNGDQVIKESIEILRKYFECFDRLTEINHLLEVPEYGYKNELRGEREELLERIDELSWKLGRL